MEKKSKGTTITDIAKICNCSIATVSRVLNNADYPVKDEMRKKIKQIAKEMHYTPNIFGKILKGGRNKEIGVLLPNMTNYFYIQVLLGIESECESRGYSVVICSSHDSSEVEKRQIKSLHQKCVAGMIMSTINKNNVFLNSLLEEKTNIIFLDQNYMGWKEDRVAFDFYRSGYMATEHLIKKGHRRIAFLSLPIDRNSRTLYLQGYKKALEENRIEFQKELVLTSPANTQEKSGIYEFESGKIVAETFLKLENRPTGVVVLNDLTAFGVINKLTEKGVNVPRDVSVIGFDNLIFSAMINPPLTTISQPSFETGRLAAKILLDKVENICTEQTQVVLQPVLIERNSVSKPRV